MADIVFNRPKKYTLIRELGSGACGKTVLLRDIDLGIEVVAKKYAPISALEADPVLRSEFLVRFRKEARILIQATHENVVRVYTYYDYPEESSAFFIMEYVNGSNIIEYAQANPASCESVFIETISGFSYLAEKGITHRDIRPQNILVSETGQIKIIDFGFAKVMADDSETLSTIFTKSITLNWWASRPTDFQSNIYDETTEVYFVGKLLEEAIRSSAVEKFRYREVIEKMTTIDRSQRLKSFLAAIQLVSQIDLGEFTFTPAGVNAYREFSKALTGTISKIHTDSTYFTDIPKIIKSLERLHLSVMLEEFVPENTKITSTFIKGSYTYFRKSNFPVELLTGFLTLLKSLNETRQATVLSNLCSRLDSIPRYSDTTMDDEIPF